MADNDPNRSITDVLRSNREMGVVLPPMPDEFLLHDRTADKIDSDQDESNVQPPAETSAAPTKQHGSDNNGDPLEIIFAPSAQSNNQLDRWENEYYAADQRRANETAARAERIRRSPLRRDPSAVRDAVAGLRSLHVFDRIVMKHYPDALDLLVMAMEAGSFAQGWGVAFKAQLANHLHWENIFRFLTAEHQPGETQEAVPTNDQFARQREHLASLIEADMAGWVTATAPGRGIMPAAFAKLVSIDKATIHRAWKPKKGTPKIETTSEQQMDLASATKWAEDYKRKQDNAAEPSEDNEVVAQRIADAQRSRQQRTSN